MGGSGSGRWNYYQKKLTTEECWTLNVADLPCGHLDGGTSGVLRAVRISKGRRRALPVRYTVECMKEGWAIALSYHLPGQEPERREVSEQVQLLSTRPNFGGKRWWFACPLQLNAKTCNHRVGKLYLPSGESQFGCRQCHDLTYRSSQESHRYDGLYSLIAGESSGEVFDAVKEVFSHQRRMARRQRRDRTRGLLEAFDKAFG